MSNVIEDENSKDDKPNSSKLHGTTELMDDRMHAEATRTIPINDPIKQPSSATSILDTPKIFVVAPLIAYAAAELAIYSGIELDGLAKIHQYGIVDALESVNQRKLQLTLHYLAQIAVTPLVLLTSFRFVWRKRVDVTVKHFASGLLLVGLMGSFLFFPNNVEYTKASGRIYIAIPLMERFNLAYSIAQGLFAFSFSLGLAMAGTWIAQAGLTAARLGKSAWKSIRQ